MFSWMHSKGRPGRDGLFASALCAALPGLLAANAVIVTVGGTDYDVLFFPPGESFDDNEAALMATPWWRDPTLADNVADAYLAQIGVAGSPFSGFPTSLFLAWEEATVSTPSDTIRVADLNESAALAFVAPSVTPAVSFPQSLASGNAA